MKGFKDKEGKFRPTENKSGVRMKRDKSITPNQGVKLDSGIRMARDDIKPKLPKPYSPEWNKLKDEVEKRIDRDFNHVRLENVNKLYPDWWEDVIITEPRLKDLKDHFGEYNLTDAQFKKKHTEDELDDAKQELMDEQREVMWGTLLEAKDSLLADKIRENSDALINDAGITIIDLEKRDEDGAYSTGVFLGINGAGYDFFEQHWIPMYRIFGWI